MNKGIQKLAQETEQNYNMQVQTNRKQETDFGKKNFECWLDKVLLDILIKVKKKNH